MQWYDVTRKILGRTLGGHAKFWGAVAPPGTPLAQPLDVTHVLAFDIMRKQVFRINDLRYKFYLNHFPV